MGNIVPRQSTAIVPQMPPGIVRVEPDDARFKCKYHVNSASSDEIYRISYDSAPGAGWWICSCRGCKSHGHCKHLRAAARFPTRADIMAKRISDGKTPPPSKPSQPKPQYRFGRR